MNDFDDTIGEAVSHRADNAPHDRPDFGDVLDARQQRLRRRSVVGAVGVLAIGLTGMAAFAVGGPPESTADGPVGSDGPFATTTYVPGLAAPGESVWYCEGALDTSGVAPIAPTTTMMTPQTTITFPDQPDQAVPEASTIPDVGYLPPAEDSGYFRSCVLIEDGTAVVAPSDEGPVATYIERYPTTTILATGEAITTDIDDVAVPGPAVTAPSDSQTYVVQKGDYPGRIADLFGFSLEDLLEFNGWTSFDEFPFPGETISIPPGAVLATTTTSLLDE